MTLLRDATIVGCSALVCACASDEGGVSPLFGTGGAVEGGTPSVGEGGSGAGSEGSPAPDDGGPASASASADDGGSDGFKFDIGASGDLGPGGGEGGNAGEGCKYLDILFVVDISGSMQEEKANLAANFPHFVEVLDDYVADPSKGALGYRLGVTNSSFQADGSTTGLDGALANRGGLAGTDDCGTGGAYWLDGPSASISADFTCLAQNPVACMGSCSDLGRERPLDAMLGFVDESAPGHTNDGFYRGDESLLVIVTLTDEDDGSDASPATAKAGLDDFVQGEDRYVVVTIAGPENGACESAFGEADPAPLLHAFTNSIPNGLMGDICQGDLTQSLQDALELITFSCDVLPPPEG